MLHASDKLRYLIGKCMRQTGNLINYFDFFFFELVFSLTGGHYEDSLRAPENFATPLVGSMNFLLITV